MINISFRKLDEEKPKEGSEVVLLKLINTPFEMFTDFVQGTVSYEYCEVDEEGTFTGNSFYEPTENSVEIIRVDDVEMTEADYWCYNDYWWGVIEGDLQLETFDIKH